MNLFRSKRSKRRDESQRFYLLPGQGGAAYRRKQKFILTWSIIAALILSALFSALAYWLNSSKF
jgi:hypothetical protein